MQSPSQAAAQGQGPWSDAGYRNGSDIDSDNYTAAHAAEQQLLADNRSALNAANVGADSAYYSAPTPEHLQAAFRQSERDYRSTTENSVASSGHVAQVGDSISRIVGSSDPQAIGNFMRANGMTSSNIEVGRNYFRPDEMSAYGDSVALGQAVLNNDNARLAALAKERFAFSDGRDARDIRESFVYRSRVSREMGDLQAQAEIKATAADSPKLSKWDGKSRDPYASTRQNIEKGIILPVLAAATSPVSAEYFAVGAFAGGTTNYAFQASTKPEVDLLDVGNASITGGLTFGKGILPSLIINSTGAYIAGTAKGEDVGAKMGAAALGTVLGAPAGQAAGTVARNAALVTTIRFEAPVVSNAIAVSNLPLNGYSSSFVSESVGLGFDWYSSTSRQKN